MRHRHGGWGSGVLPRPPAFSSPEPAEPTSSFGAAGRSRCRHRSAWPLPMPARKPTLARRRQDPKRSDLRKAPSTASACVQARSRPGGAACPDEPRQRGRPLCCEPRRQLTSYSLATTLYCLGPLLALAASSAPTMACASARLRASSGERRRCVAWRRRSLDHACTGMIEPYV